MVPTMLLLLLLRGSCACSLSGALPRALFLTHRDFATEAAELHLAHRLRHSSVPFFFSSLTLANTLPCASMAQRSHLLIFSLTLHYAGIPMHNPRALTGWQYSQLQPLVSDPHPLCESRSVLPTQRTHRDFGEYKSPMSHLTMSDCTRVTGSSSRTHPMFG
jgi:hypothetical protein